MGAFKILILIASVLLLTPFAHLFEIAPVKGRTAPIGPQEPQLLRLLFLSIGNMSLPVCDS
jgi:hypothetical protein